MWALRFDSRALVTIDLSTEVDKVRAALESRLTIQLFVAGEEQLLKIRELFKTSWNSAIDVIASQMHLDELVHIVDTSRNRASKAVIL